MCITRILVGPWVAVASDAAALAAASVTVALAMTARSKLRGQQKEAASSFCPFAHVESFLVAKVSIGTSIDHCLLKAGSPTSQVVDRTTEPS